MDVYNTFDTYGVTFTTTTAPYATYIFGRNDFAVAALPKEPPVPEAFTATLVT
jgi:hypothetical protein